MAKKTRRPNLSQETLERARRELNMTGPVVETPADSGQPAAAVAAKAAPRRVVYNADLSTEYAYVANDLRNMAMLAAGMMSVLVILSFFI